MTDYQNKQQQPKQAPKHEVNDKKGKRLREQEERGKRKIRSYYGGTNPND